MKCDHCRGDGSASVNFCELLHANYKRRVCYGCRKNTAKGIWPAKETLPVVCIGTVKGHAVASASFLLTPHDQWPDLALEIEGNSHPGDIGVGDTLAQKFKALGVDEWAKENPAAARKAGQEMLAGIVGEADAERFYKGLTEPGCGCEATRRYLNERFPYLLHAT